MVKAPSGRAFESKFKSWRKGKGKGKAHSGSLRQQLRGLERLKQKKEANNEDTSGLEDRIATLRKQVEEKSQGEKERSNAQKSHKARFLDRQRTSRLYTQLSKQDNTEKLRRLALDQVYIAHYPLDKTTYVNLYQSGKRRVFKNRLLFKVALQRKTVLERLANTSEPHGRNHKVSWIKPAQYDLVKDFRTWSTDQERDFFGVQDGGQARQDPRFKATKSIQGLLEKQERLDQEDGEMYGASSANGNPGKESLESLASDDNKVAKRAMADTADDRSLASSSSSESASSSSDASTSSSLLSENTNDAKLKARAVVSTIQQGDTEEKKQEHFDDFLVEAKEGMNSFDSSKKVPAWDAAAGDKSQGWATQRQLPGEFRKRQRR